MEMCERIDIYFPTWGFHTWALIVRGALLVSILFSLSRMLYLELELLVCYRLGKERSNSELKLYRGSRKRNA